MWMGGSGLLGAGEKEGRLLLDAGLMNELMI